MSYPPLSPEAIEQLQHHEPFIKSRRAYKRWRGVCLTLIEAKPLDEVATALALNPRTLQKHQKRYRDEGLSAFADRSTGRRGPRLLTAEQEAAFFCEKEKEANAGEIVRGTSLYSDYVGLLDKPCCLMTLYNALKRNGWSKKAPRPRHPKGDDEAKTLFKKTQ
jgi:transposase